MIMHRKRDSEPVAYSAADSPKRLLVAEQVKVQLLRQEPEYLLFDMVAKNIFLVDYAEKNEFYYLLKRRAGNTVFNLQHIT